ncbi:MAG: amino acid permease [Heteroscytonema crispum UTEX LB 1556]
MKTVLKLDTPAPEPTRLFSHIKFDGNKLTHQPGSVLGSTALIAGTTIGVGILELPAVTLPSGVVPSTVLLIAVWLYSLISGLLIAEVTLNTMRFVGRPNLGLLVIVESTLGFLGSRIAAVAYLFLGYALLVAYISQGGEILVSAASQVCGVQNVFPAWVGIATFTLLFGGMMYLGREKFVEKLNNAFVAIVIASFVGILLLSSTHLQTAQLLFQDWSALTPAVSVMLVALFYHNVVPLIVAQLEGDARKIRSSIVIGSVIPPIMFLAWNTVILGSVSPDIVQDISNGRTIFDPLQILRSGSAGEWLGALVSVFSEFAILTSFIGIVYSLLDFFKGIFNVDNNEPYLSQSLYLLILGPPMILGALNPSIFFTALDYAGTFSISVLAGIIPALMIWKQREAHSHLNSINQQLVGGGKVILIVMIGIASLIIWA